MTTSIDTRRGRGRLTTPTDSLIRIYKGGIGPIRTFIMTNGLADATVAVYHGSGLTLDMVIAEAAGWLPDPDELPNGDDWWAWTITGGKGKVLARVWKDFRTGKPAIERPDA